MFFFLMIRRPPRSTRTDTRFPYTTRVRSAPYERDVEPGSEFVVLDVPGAGRFGVSICYDMWFPETTRSLVSLGAEVILHPTLTNTIDRDVEIAIARASAATNQCYFVDINRSDERRVGKECVSTCSSRWSPYH